MNVSMICLPITVKYLSRSPSNQTRAGQHWTKGFYM